MYIKKLLYIFVSILTLTTTIVKSQYIHGGFTINDNQYTLNWEVYGGYITFRAIGNGTGFIGFGISPKGTMEGSDLFISGMYENGTAYGFDSHGSGEKDAMSNYELIYVMAGHMYTEVHFRRMLHTGDCKDDITIMNEPQYIIWSIGPDMDKLEHHGPMNRGSVLVNLLNPPMFHSYYYTNKNMDADATMKMCMEINKRMGIGMDMGMGMGGGGGGGGESPPPAPAADEKPAEENAVDE